jgi:pyruvate formate lyase activating enzyme
VDVRRDSREDGPGIRTVVFFKGYPLRCVFCHNPEAQEAGPEIAFATERCLRCGACVVACSRAVIDLDRPGRIDRNRCDACGHCAEACRGGALRLVGEFWPVEKLAKLLLRDVPFYRHSGGGVTLSGGECTMYPDYLRSLLVELKLHGIHVTLETCGEFNYEVFARQVLPHLDLIFFDLKILDGEESLRRLGRSNARILANLRRLLAQGAAEVRTRVPLIPGVTDRRENLAAIVDFLCAAGAKDVSLLPYNPLGMAMYPALGRSMPSLPPAFTAAENEEEMAGVFREIIAERTRQLEWRQPE